MLFSLQLRSLKSQLSRLAEDDKEFAAILEGVAVSEKSEYHDEKKQYIDNTLMEISDLEKIAKSPVEPSQVPK